MSALIFYYGSVLVASSEFTVKNVLMTFSMLLFSIGYAGTVLSWSECLANLISVSNELTNSL